MSSREPRAQQRSRRTGAAPAASSERPCPCGLAATYAECCGRLHAGQPAATATALMRSRYAAFAVRDEAYLLRTWHPDTRPPRLDLDDTVRWTGLEIVDATDGSAFHTTGTVTFRAHFTERGQPGELAEHSRFTRHNGAWVYVAGEVPAH